VKDRDTRESKGVAFVLFVRQEDANTSIKTMDGKEVFGRKIKCSIAKDNGRAKEFIKKKIYKDKSKCYECGESGHLSYKCPKNALGEREKITKKKKKRKRKQEDEEGEDEYEHGFSDSDEDLPRRHRVLPAKAIRAKNERDSDSDSEFDSSLLFSNPASNPGETNQTPKIRERKARKSGYFSDEDASD